MRKILISVVLALVVFITVSCYTRNVNKAKDELTSMKSVYSNVMETLNFFPPTRITGTQGDIDTTRVIKEFLENCDYKVELQEFEYNLTKQGFAFLKDEKLWEGFEVQSTGKSNNIIAYKDRDESKKDVIVCAHYDTTEKNQVNDNGIGVSIILNCAKNISASEKYNIIYVFFTGEAQLIGSKYYVSALTEKEKENIVAVINLDEICGESNVKVGFNDGEKNEAYYIFEDVVKDATVDISFNTVESILLEKYGIPVMNIGQLPKSDFEVVEVNPNKENVEQAYRILCDCLNKK